MTAARAIGTLVALGLVALVVMAAVGTVYALISLATWPRRIRARRNNSRAFVAHAATVVARDTTVVARDTAWGAVDRQLTSQLIPTQRSAS